MARTNKSKIGKLIGVLIILLGALAVFSYMALYNGGVTVKKTDSKEVVRKLAAVMIKGGEFELIQKDVDELSNLYFPEPKSKGDIIVKGVNMEMLNDELLILMPFTYKNQNLVFTSRGKLSYANGEIQFAAESFKIGKLPLPKKIVLSEITKYTNENFYVKDNLIKIKGSVLPFKIQDLKIVDNKMVGIAEKMDIKSLFENFEKGLDSFK